jgi:hypothetical protein
MSTREQREAAENVKREARIARDRKNVLSLLMASLILEIKEAQADDETKWPPAQQNLATMYCANLTEGSATTPTGLQPHYEERVRWLFARSCKTNSVRQGTLPGQDASWYSVVKRTAPQLSLSAARTIIDQATRK